jgi:hypothetical protein
MGDRTAAPVGAQDGISERCLMRSRAFDADLDTHALYGAGERFLCRFGTTDRLPEPKSTTRPSTPT